MSRAAWLPCAGGSGAAIVSAGGMMGAGPRVVVVIGWTHGTAPSIYPGAFAIYGFSGG
jgi:hypothetical protein